MVRFFSCKKLTGAAWNNNDRKQILKGFTDDIELLDGTTFINRKKEFKKFTEKRYIKFLMLAIGSFCYDKNED